MSGLQDWQADGVIIAHCGDRFQCHVAGALDGPFVVLFEKDRADEARDGRFVGKDADHLGAALDFEVDAFEGIGNRYDDFGADAPLQLFQASAYAASIRDRGSGSR
jgi:hypothetical protein